VLVTLVDVSCVCGFLYITKSVSLVVVRFLRNALESHYGRVWYRWPVIIWRFANSRPLNRLSQFEMSEFPIHFTFR